MDIEEFLSYNWTTCVNGEEVSIHDLPADMREHYMSKSPEIETVWVRLWARKGILYVLTRGGKGSVDGFPMTCNRSNVSFN